MSVESSQVPRAGGTCCWLRSCLAVECVGVIPNGSGGGNPGWWECGQDILLSFHFRGSDNIHLLSCKLLKEKKKERSEGGGVKGGRVKGRKEAM